MRRTQEEFVAKVDAVIPLAGLSVLEVGCGDGTRSVEIAKYCGALTGIEPDELKLPEAQARNIPSASFLVGSAEALPFNDHTFDLVCFTLSLHHVPVAHMKTAIDEAIRVVRPSGAIVFLEPTERGNFFEAELQFDACDGDERPQKVAAYTAMMHHKGLQLIKEIDDETLFEFDSAADYQAAFHPRMNQEQLADFLKQHNYLLRAGRRISIFLPSLGI